MAPVVLMVVVAEMAKQTLRTRVSGVRQKTIYKTGPTYNARLARAKLLHVCMVCA